MAAIATLPVLLGTGIHSARPAAADVGSGGLYSCTTHDLVYQTDGATWTTWASVGGTTSLDAIIAASSGEDIADALSGAATPDAGNVFATMADVTGGTVYELPNLSNAQASFAGSGTSLVVTMTAPTAGDNLVIVVYANARGANSITQTNVVWTQRYTGNGNGSYLEVWTGVVSASAGTTATIAFTGSNGQYAQSFVVDAVTPFTSATALTTTTNTTALVSLEATGTTGGYVLWAVVGWLVGSSYHGCNHPYAAYASFGGAGRYGLLRVGVDKSIQLWSLSSGTGNHFGALVAMA